MQGILEGLEKRFGEYYSNKVYILACVTIPKFKIGWIFDEDKRIMARSLPRKEFDGFIVMEPSSSSSERRSEEDFISSMTYQS